MKKNLVPKRRTTSTGAKFGVTPNLDAPKTATERRAVATFKALQEKERGFTQGIEFGRAMIDLRKEMPHGQWMPRLKELGISYEKARYWIAVVEDRPTQRGKVAGKAGKISGDWDSGKAEKQTAWDSAKDWNTAAAKLEPLVQQIEILMRDDPNGSALLIHHVERLADILGYEVMAKTVAEA